MTLPEYLSGGRIQGRTTDSLASAEVAYTTDCFDNNDDDRDSDNIGYRSGNHRMWGGVKVVGGGALDGKYATKIRVKLHVIGATTGNLVGHIRSGIASGNPGSQGTLRKTSTNTINLATIQDSTVFIEFTFDGLYAFGTNSDEFIGIYWAQAESNASGNTIAIALRWNDVTENTADVISTTNDGAPGETDFEFWNTRNTNMSITTQDPATAKDKSSITNVPIGTRYEEIDTRKIFRRKAGGGAAQNTNIFNLTYSAEKQASVTAGDDPTGKATVAHEGQNPESKVWTTGLTTTGNTKTFEIKFRIVRGGSDSGNNWGIWFGSDVWDDDSAGGTDKQIFVRAVNGNTFQFSLEDAAGTNEDATMTLQSAGTKYYTITGNGTTAKCEYWSTAARTGTADSSSGNVSFPTAWLTRDAIDSITFGGWGGGGNTINIDVHDVSIKWDSGLEDSWVERGTA